MRAISNNQIKLIRSLSQKKFREKYGLFIVEGDKLVDEVSKSDFVVRDIFKSDEIGNDAMKKMSCLSTPSPVIAVVEQKNYKLSDINLPEIFKTKNDALFMGLCGVRDPGNLGTIIRIADWFGIDAIFCSCDTVDVYNPKTVQATMGSIFRKKIIYEDIKTVIELFNAGGKPVYGTFLNGENIYSKNLTKEGLILFGNESNGIPDEIGKMVSERLFIPSYPIAENFSLHKLQKSAENIYDTSESLNVAISSAIICAEFRK